MTEPVFKNTVLFVQDIAISRNFYENVLYQKIGFDFGTNVSYVGGLSLWQLSEKHLLYKQLVSDQNTKKTNRIELYFEVDDIKFFYKTLESSNVRFLHRLHIEEWQQMTLRFFDPDRHLIEVGESLKSLVRRLLAEGNNLEEISKTTHLDIDYVKILAGD